MVIVCHGAIASTAVVGWLILSMILQIAAVVALLRLVWLFTGMRGIDLARLVAAIVRQFVVSADVPEDDVFIPGVGDVRQPR